MGQIDHDDAIQLYRDSSSRKNPMLEIRLQSFMLKFCPDDMSRVLSVFTVPTVLRGRITKKAFEEAEGTRESWQIFFEAKVNPSVLREYGYAMLVEYRAPYGGYMEPRLLKLLPPNAKRPLTSRERMEVEAQERFERRLSAARGGRQATIIALVDSPDGYEIGGRGSVLDISIHGFRVDRGAYSARRATVFKERSTQRTINRVPRHSVIRFRGIIGESDDFNEPQILLERLLEVGVRDREAEEHLESIKNPPKKRDKKLGQFVFDRSSGFVGKIKISTRAVGLVMACESADAYDAVRDRAHVFAKRPAAYVKEFTAFAAENMLDTVNDTWLADFDEPPISEIAFKRRMKPETIAVDAEGGVTIEYDVGDLLGGHAVLVSGTLGDGPRECTIEG